MATTSDQYLGNDPTYHCRPHCEMCAKVHNTMDILACKSRIIGHAPSRSEIRTRLQTSLQITAGHIIEVVLLGRGLFMLQLVESADADRLVSQSSFTVSDRLIMVVPWYPISSFEERHAVPRHPMTLRFPSLPFHLRRAIREIQTSFETPLRGDNDQW